MPYTTPDPNQGLVLYKVFYSSSFWDPVINKVSRRLDGWKKVFLFLRRRTTLIQFCLSHIPSYFLPFSKILTSIALRIEKLQRDFLWSCFERAKEIIWSIGI